MYNINIYLQTASSYILSINPATLIAKPHTDDILYTTKPAVLGKVKTTLSEQTGHYR